MIAYCKQARKTFSAVASDFYVENCIFNAVLLQIGRYAIIIGKRVCAIPFTNGEDKIRTSKAHPKNRATTYGAKTEISAICRSV